MRYVTCTKKGCGRAFVGYAGLAIHQGRAHKTTTRSIKDGGTNGKPSSNGTISGGDELDKIKFILTSTEELSPAGLRYVLYRTVGLTLLDKPSVIETGLRQHDTTEAA